MWRNDTKCNCLCSLWKNLAHKGLTHCGLEMIYGVVDLGLHQVGAWSASSHCLGQCWLIVNWSLRNKFQWYFLIKGITFHPRKCFWKRCLQNAIHFVQAAIHYGDIIMGTIASQITSLTIVYSTIYSDADQRKHQSSASLAFVRGIHRGPVNSLHKWPVTWKMFPFDDVIMSSSHYELAASDLLMKLDVSDNKSFSW